MTRTAPPRTVAPTRRHHVGDLLTLGSTRWLIRSIAGDQVVLEAANTAAGIIWTTTLDNLPDPRQETP